MSTDASASQKTDIIIKYPFCKSMIGLQGWGEALNKSKEKVCIYQGDLLGIAKAENLNLDILAGTLSSDSVLHMYKSCGQETFVSLLKTYLADSAGTVRILVWRAWDECRLAPEIRQLMHNYSGRFEVRFSNDEDTAEEVNHFSVAYEGAIPDPLQGRILVRWEDKHSKDVADDFPATLSFVPELSERKPEQRDYLALSHGRKLIGFFNTMFQSSLRVVVDAELRAGLEK